MADPQFYSGLTDQYGRPIRRELLPQRISAPTITGVRQPVGMMASAGLDPRRLARILREAEEDDPERYLALAEEMEEKDLHYLSVLGTRKRQVSQLQITVSAPDGVIDPRAKLATDLVQKHLINSGVIKKWLFDGLDAVGKGFSLSEIVWNTTTRPWTVQAIERVDPRFVRFDRITRERPLLLGNNGAREELEPAKFVFLKLQAKSGIPIRGGLARAVAWAFLFKNFALKDWVQFAEIYGLPLRLGKYDSSASADDKDALLAALRMIAIDAAGIIPRTMEIEFVEAAQKGSSADLYKLLYDTMDAQVSKAVLGQTATTDAVPGQLGSGNQHTEVREDIERADADVLSVVLNEQLVRPFVDFNVGRLGEGNYPVITIGRAETKNAQLIVDAAQKLVPLGLRIGQTDVLEAIGVSVPGDDDKVLTPPAYIPRPDQATPAGIFDARSPFGPAGTQLPFGPAGAPPANDTQAAIGAARTRAALLAAELRDADPIARAAAQGDGAELGPVIAQVMHIAAISSTPQECVRRIRALAAAGGADVSELTDTLASEMFQALAGGVAGDRLQ